MATATNLMTWEAFEQLPDTFTHKEILEGELIELPPPKPKHSDIAKNAYDHLAPFVKANRLGRVYLEAGYQLSTNPPTWIQPDVSFISAARRSATVEGHYFTEAPELAIEVLSPSDRPKDMQRKIALLLAAGANAVWVIDPGKNQVHLHSAHAISELRTEGQILTAPDLLPGFELPVSALFAE